MGKTWSSKERADRQHKKSFIKFKQERKTKRHVDDIPPKRDKNG
jgi:hypothetical protein